MYRRWRRVIERTQCACRSRVTRSKSPARAFSSVGGDLRTTQTVSPGSRDSVAVTPSWVHCAFAVEAKGFCRTSPLGDVTSRPTSPPPPWLEARTYAERRTISPSLSPGTGNLTWPVEGAPPDCRRRLHLPPPGAASGAKEASAELETCHVSSVACPFRSKLPLGMRLPGGLTTGSSGLVVCSSQAAQRGRERITAMTAGTPDDRTRGGIRCRVMSHDATGTPKRQSVAGNA